MTRQEDMMEKKPYTAPKVTEHGKAIEQTKGMGGRFFESLMPKVISDYDKPSVQG